MLEPRSFQEAVEGQVVPSDYYGNVNAWDNWYDAPVGHTEHIPGLGDVTLVEIEDRSMIFKVVDDVEHTISYFRKDGHYDKFWKTHDWLGTPPIKVDPVVSEVTVWVEP